MKQLPSAGSLISYLDRDLAFKISSESLSSTPTIRNCRYCIYLLKRDQRLIQHSWKFNTWLQKVCLGFTNCSVQQTCHNISNIIQTLPQILKNGILKSIHIQVSQIFNGFSFFLDIIFLEQFQVQSKIEQKVQKFLYTFFFPSLRWNVQRSLRPFCFSSTGIQQYKFLYSTAFAKALKKRIPSFLSVTQSLSSIVIFCLLK